MAEAWKGEPRPDGEESVEIRFVELGSPPDPIHPPTAHALDLLGAYLTSGRFQVR